MNIRELYIGRNVRIKTEEDIYDSYISAITLKDENFVYFKSGNLRIDLLDKLKKKNEGQGNKVDVTGGTIRGNLNIVGALQIEGNRIENPICDKKYYTGSCNDVDETCVLWVNGGIDCPPQLNGVNYGFLFTKAINDNYIEQEFADANTTNRYTRSKIGESWKNWVGLNSIGDYRVCSLTNTNVSLYDERIKNSRYVIVFYTFQRTSERYIASAILSTTNSEWNIVLGIQNGANNRLGYISLATYDTSELRVSTYSDNEFEVVGYNLIF